MNVISHPLIMRAKGIYLRGSSVTNILAREILRFPGDQNLVYRRVFMLYCATAARIVSRWYFERR